MDWFRVICGDEAIQLDVRPPGGEAWDATIPVETVTRVCLELGDFLASDTIYLFVAGRAASYMIPTDCVGGAELSGYLVSQNLVNGEEWIAAMTSSEGLRCWPPVDEEEAE